MARVFFDHLSQAFKGKHLDLEFARLPLAIRCGPSDDRYKVGLEGRHRLSANLSRSTSRQSGSWEASESIDADER
jgi:hypothetical protein